MTRTTILALLVSGALSLSGCGGGGGGGGGSSSSSGGGSSSSSSSGGNGGTFTVTATTVSLAAKRMTTPPAAIIVTANVNDSRTAAVGAAYRPGVTPAAWLDVGLVQINPQRYEFSFEVNSTGTALAAGTYTTTVAVGSTDASGNVLHSRDIAVTLVVREGVRFQFNGFGAQGTAGSNWMLPTQVVSVIAPPNTQWTLTSGVPWMSVPPGTRTGSVDVTVTMDPSTLPGGNFEGLLTATNVTDATDNSTSRAFFNVLANCPSYSIKEFVNPGIVGGTSGLDHGPMPVYFNLGSGTNQFGWSVTGPTWLHFDTTSGMVSSAETHFSVSADLSQLSPGEHTGTLELRSHVNGQDCLNPIQIRARVEPNRLQVAAEGVAFSKFPGSSVLQRTVRVLATRTGSGVSWTASDDAAWLSVTGSGTTAGVQGGALQLTANPTGLAAGQYFAEVTVVPVNAADVQNTQEKVRVGLTVRSVNPPATVDYASQAVLLAINPVAPEFYASDGMGNLNVYDVYSGALLRTFAGKGWAGLGSPRGDGRVIYLRGATFVELDPATGNVLREWAASSSSPGGGLLYARPDAHPVLLTGDNLIVDLDANLRIGDNNDTLMPRDVSTDQRIQYGRDPFGSGIYRARSMRYSSLENQRMVYGRIGLFETGDSASDYRDVAVSKVSGKVFVARGGGDIRGIQAYTPPPFTLATLVPIADEHVTFLATSWNGRLAALDAKFSGGNALRLYDDDLVASPPKDAGAGETWYAAPTLLFSGDGTRVITSTSTVGRIHAVN